MDTNTEVAPLKAATVTRTRPLRRDAERNRQLILGAAKTVFANRGLEASLDEIAKEAGLGVGTVYRRFPNREALIDALFDDTLAFIENVVEECVAQPRAWDGLVHFMTEMLEKQGRDKGLRDAMIARERHLNACDAGKDDLVRDIVEPALYDLVRRAHQEGDLRTDVTTTDLGVLLIAAVNMVELTSPVAPDVWRRQLSIILDGLRARPAGANTELTQPPLDDEQVNACMAGWKYGSHATPRQRPRPS
jgi:AcrR family transcriptional regulator